MKYLYYCNSTYQLINILNLHWQRKSANFENINNYSADLIVLDTFKGAKDIFDIIEKENLFNKCWLVPKADNSGLWHLFETSLDIMFPSLFLKNKYGISKSDVNNYDYLVVPKFSRITGAIWQLNKSCKLHLHEDGTTTYFSSMKFLVSNSKTYKTLYRLMNYGRDFTDYEVIYLTKPDLFIGEDRSKLRGIPKFNGNYLKEIVRYFEEFAQDNSKSEKNIFWLHQVKRDGVKGIMEDVLKKNKEKVIFCPHPRYERPEVDLFETTPNKQSWEMRVLNTKDIDKKCLISVDSTACISPKILFNKEPFVIFTYKLLQENDSPCYKEFEQLADKFKGIYSNPGKIMIPNTKEEFENYINKFLNQQNGKK